MEPKKFFQPAVWVRNPHLQTTITSLIKYDTQKMHQTSQPIYVTVADGIRLSGVYSRHSASRGLVLLLHGWLGCMDSNYLLAIGEQLYRAGFSVVRLNLRDHGDSYTLNQGLFRSDRLAEVFEAVQQIAAFEPNQPFLMVGVSLGGNFTLRVMWQESFQPIPNFRQAMAINPVMNPYRSTEALDGGWWVYLNYFRRRWRRAFAVKQAAFPHLYNFERVYRAKTCMEMTEWFMQDYGPYPDAVSYLRAYAITPQMIESIRTPTLLLTSVDDPVVPVEDFWPLADLNPQVTVEIHPYGGHVGFMDVWPPKLWLADAVVDMCESTILATQ